MAGFAKLGRFAMSRQGAALFIAGQRAPWCNQRRRHNRHARFLAVATYSMIPKSGNHFSEKDHAQTKS
jgi:hypothetical protein